MRHHGITLWMKEKQYDVIADGKTVKYPIGGLIADYVRIPLVKLKDVAATIPHGDMELAPDKLTLMEEHLFSGIDSMCTCVQSDILKAEFWNFCSQVTKYSEDMIKGSVDFYTKYQEQEKVAHIIPEEAWIQVPELSTMKDLFLLYYTQVLKNFILVNLMLDVAESNYRLFGEYNPEGIGDVASQTIFSFFEHEMNAQEIDYKILYIDGVFTPTYTIQSAISLMVFDFAQVCENNIGLCRCQNCGKIFVPIGRSDAKYCSYPLEEDNSKTCKDVGAQNTRAEKEKNDVITKSYRKVYMRYMVHMSRHPEDVEKQKKLDQLTEEVKVKRKELQDGIISEEQFLDWLNQF